MEMPRPLMMITLKLHSYHTSHLFLNASQEIWTQIQTQSCAGFTRKIQHFSSVIVQFLCTLLTLTGKKAATNGKDYPEGKKSRTKETRD